MRRRRADRARPADGGCDIDKVHTLNTGKAPFFERDLDDLLAKHTASGRLKFTASYQEAAEFADLHFVGVGTPQQPGSDAYDLTHLFGAVRELAPCLTTPAVIAVKSTVPVGTAPRVAELQHEHAPAGDRIEVAWNPEFLRESFAVEDTLRPDRLVLGFNTDHSWAEALLRQAFGKIIEAGTPTIVTDWATAELAKGAANSFQRQVDADRRPALVSAGAAEAQHRLDEPGVRGQLAFGIRAGHGHCLCGHRAQPSGYLTGPSVSRHGSPARATVTTAVTVSVAANADVARFTAAE
ncbi:hypothetical protein ABZ208_38430 [Streptomyces sp. NPDC006208]|uniref:hypothetical protein n=1 Tax=Streptomyces sp. NPDC006208 TaxID=3156734 RepID=UPI0033A7CBC3